MLAKNIISDSHTHLLQKNNNFFLQENYAACICVSTQEEFLVAEELSKKNKKILVSFGIHPYNPTLENKIFLEDLLLQNKISAIGETGLDFYTNELKKNKEAQLKAYFLQIEFATRFNKPLVIHARKSFEELFKSVSFLKKCPAVIFHSFGGTISQADFFIKNGVNAYFSFSKSILSNSKKTLECIKNLPKEKILLETDGHFDVGSNFILNDFYKKLFELRGISKDEIFKTFQNAYGIDLSMLLKADQLNAT